MRRIVVFPDGEGWAFEREAQPPFTAKTVLRAAVAAKEYGESMRGRALGYVIRMEHAHGSNAAEMITLDTEIFTADVVPSQRD